MNFNIGKGTYIWQPKTIEDGDPDRIVARLQMAGVQTVALKLCDGMRVFDDLLPLVKALRRNNILVIGWGYSYLNLAPREEAKAAIKAMQMYEPEHYLVDVEAEVEKNHGGARMFVNALRPEVRDTKLGLNTFWNAEVHPDFPWAVFLDAVDFVCPQVYWRAVDPVGKLIRSQQTYSEIEASRQVPMPVVAGDLYTSRGVQPTAEQVTQFMTAADSDPFLQGVLMWAADDTQTTPELWKAFSSYEWKKGGTPIPPQPIGWAKIKARDGLNVRSAPGGAKMGGFGKDEMTPIWAVSDTQWAAVTQAGDRWIFIGNPTYVQLAMDVPVPPPPTGLYQARVVPVDGVNVRDNPNGNKLRALACGTVLQIYEEKSGFGRIHPTHSEWVCLPYLSRVA